MGSFSIWHWLIVLAVVLLLFGGAGKIPKLMRDMGQGITAFKRGLKDENKSENKDEGQEQAIDSSARVVEKDKVAS
jgi:sec-independent protein translocase protein TatA